MPPMAGERLQKLIARAGLTSRRGAEQLIADGRVTVNGRHATLGDVADPERDRIEVDGRPLGAAPAAIHLAVHKPRGFLSSARDERGRRSVVTLVDAGRERLWPAGRLDVESEGLMILTNDGEWANRVLHPRYGNEREYAALIDPPPSAATLARLRSGVDLEDGPARVISAHRGPPPREVARGRSERGTWLRVRIGEGRKREVRRLFEAVGSDVERLVRVRIGTLTLAGLREGEWRRLRRSEVSALSGSRRR
jgi:23S rRNA pseudouridine2605 synthase